MSNWKEMTLIELKEQNVRVLQSACKEAGIPSGTAKDDMAQRLFEHLAKTAADAATQTDSEATPAVPDGSETSEPDEKPDPQLLTSPLETESQVGKPCRMSGCKGTMQARGSNRIRCNGRRNHEFDI
jgi:hypothetical protein